MDDLIFRQAAIEEIQNAYCDTECGKDWCAVWKNKGMYEALRILEDVPPAQRWIPVTERLPEDAGTYIICDCYGNVMSRHFCKKSDKFAGYWHANGSKYYGNPTHWMPLPEPPKEDSNEV